MAFSQVDPASLQGEALNRWYLRSPDEIEQERQAAQAQKYNAFFWPDRADGPVDNIADFRLSGRQRNHWRRSGLGRERAQPLARSGSIGIRAGCGHAIWTISIGRRVLSRGCARSCELSHLPREGSAAVAFPLSVSSGWPIPSGYALGVLGRWLTEATLAAVRRSV